MSNTLFDWQTISVSPQATIKETLAVMDKAALQIALVVDENQHLLGTVTDGDIRRGLLAGKMLTSPVAEVMHLTPKVGLESELETLWQKRILQYQLRHLPIVDAQGKILGLYYEKPTPKTLTYPVVLMLGGLGTRLRPLTENIPKPLLPIGNQPILETIVKHISEQGFEKFYFCINYLGEQIRNYFGDGNQYGIEIEYVEESKRMGTAGALSLLQDRLNQDFIVMNGDLLTKIDLRALIEFHQQHQNLITVGVREYAQQVPYGVIEMQAHRVTQLVEKPIYRYFVNGGIYALSPQTLKDIPKQQFFDMPTLIEQTLAKGEPVGGFPITEYWMDIGQLPDYQQAQQDYAQHFFHTEAKKI